MNTNQNNPDLITVQDRQLEIIQARLKLFGNPLVCMLPDGSIIKYRQKYSVNHSLETMLQINRLYGSPYSVNFTPNGDYGKLNSAGQKVTRKAKDSSGNIYCLYLDLDQKLSPSYKDKTKEEYLEYIVGVIETNRINIQYITESGGGYHLYSFINPDDVPAVSEILGKDFGFIQKEFCSLFEGADLQCVGDERLLRLPLTVHRKTTLPILTKLYGVKTSPSQDGAYKVELFEVVHENQITLEGKTNFGPIHAERLLANLKHSKKNDTPTYKKLEKDPVFHQINDIPFPILFENLQECPRNLDGHDVRYFINGTSVIIETDGKKYTTDGYKWRKQENVLKNFSYEHTPNERPGGHVLKFLEQYFEFDYGAIAQFLKDKFEIEMFIEGGDCITELSSGKTRILFKDSGVYIILPGTKGGIALLFNSPFTVKGVIKVQKIINGKNETGLEVIIHKTNSFDDEELEGGQEIIVSFESRTVKFNEKYLKYGLSCCGSDKQLLAFNTVVKDNVRNGILPIFDSRENCGYYTDGYLIGRKIFGIDGNELDPKEKNIVLNTPDFQFCREGTDCTMSEYADKLMELFSPRESLLAFCTFIAALMGHSFRKPNLVNSGQPFMLPHLFLSGTTKTGKSTLIGLLKNGLGLIEDANKYGMTNTTALPMKRLSAIPRWLHLEEYTGDVSNKAENIVRLGINGTDGGMGRADGTFETLEFKCSYIIDGERMPSAISLLNRFIGVIMRKEDKIGNVTGLRECSELRYFRDFIKKLYCIDQKTVARDFEQAQDYLIENGVLDRNSVIYAYLICVNRWFDICEEPKLLKAILDNLQLMALGGSDISTLGAILSKRFAKTPLPKITGVHSDGIRYMTIPMDEDIFNQMRGNIATAIKEFGKKRISVNGYNVTLVININDNTEINKKFMTIVGPYIPQCMVTYEDVSVDEGADDEKQNE